jgi:hypothetical protein
MDIKLGKQYRHRSGRIYTPMMFTNMNGDDESKKEKFPPTVVYIDTKGNSWSRRIDDWDRSFTLIV